MKIVYINGFKTTSKPSNTYLFLKENLPNDEVKFCNWYYNNGINLEKIKECIKKENPDIIIASSTGGLIAEEFDIPKILINPVIERKDLEKLHPDKNFSNLPEKVNHFGNIKIIILSKNDERLDYKKALNEYKNNKIVLVNDTHRLKNKSIILQELNNLKKFLENQTYIEG